MIVISHVSQAQKQKGVHIYCGRKYGKWKASPLGNPYHADKSQPGATLPKYLEWLRGEYKDKQSPARKELERIADLERKTPDELHILMCWCHDATTCHCSVIKQAVKGILNQDISTTQKGL